MTFGAERHKIARDVRVLDAHEIVFFTPPVGESDLDDVMDLMRPTVTFGPTPLADTSVSLADVVFGVIPVLPVVYSDRFFFPSWVVLT
jgi:hypothetical protein